MVHAVYVSIVSVLLDERIICLIEQNNILVHDVMKLI